MTSLWMIFKLSMSTVVENRVRSGLTLVGMVFGNAAVIATLSSNDGAKVYIAQQLASLGNKLMNVEIPGSMSAEDLKTMQKYTDEIEFAVRELNLGNVEVRTQVEQRSAKLFGVDSEYFRAMNLSLVEGRLLADVELEASPLVAYLGAKVREALFKDQSFMNESITLNISGVVMTLRVLGAFREKGGSAGESLDRSVFIPNSLAAKIAAGAQQKVYAILKDDHRSSAAKAQIKYFLTPKFGQGVEIVDAREAIEKTQAIWSKQNLVGICLAAICLLTGGIGIMNIMLLSIHQRQKEIGLRKAVGARDAEIAMQFLIETVIICLCGGILGIGAGWLMGHQVASLLGEWKASMSAVSVMITLGFSMFTGILFGALPAMRAARIDPYDALRTG